MDEETTITLPSTTTTVRLDRGLGEGAVVVAPAVRDGGKLGRASDLLEVDVGVVRVLEPVEAPVAAVAEGRGHVAGVALAAAADAAVLLARQGLTELAPAAVEEAHAAAGHQQVEVVVAEVAARVGALHDHGLARDRPRREVELVARAAPRALGPAPDRRRREPVRQLVVDRPRRVVAARVGAAAVAARLGVGVAQRVVARVARRRRRRYRRLAAPRAARLAAVPVPRRHAAARGRVRGAGRAGDEEEKARGLGVHFDF
ncbi:hypothetical protein CIB48_g129 [Xylaria polymorpha]|nr:hypothetical protein CIB48_g129 [Xylaria polymorpha]